MGDGSTGIGGKCSSRTVVPVNVKVREKGRQNRKEGQGREIGVEERIRMKRRRSTCTEYVGCQCSDQGRVVGANDAQYSTEQYSTEWSVYSLVCSL